MERLNGGEVKEALQRQIAEGYYGEAEQTLQEYLARPEALYDDILAIYDAGIGEYYGDEERRWEAIRRGLRINSRNYELYVMLGNYYLDKNLNQSWLCYENALFYCDNEADQFQIENLMQQLKDTWGGYLSGRPRSSCCPGIFWNIRSCALRVFGRLCRKTSGRSLWWIMPLRTEALNG